MYSKLFFLIALLPALTAADFYFGVISGDMEAGYVGYPSIDSYTSEIIMLASQDICSASGFPGNPSNPSQALGSPWINWCGIPIQIDGSNLILDSSDPCGSDVTIEETIPYGYFYADLLDQNNGNANVGRCVFEQGGNSKDCGADGSQEADTSVHCYTSALN